MKRLLTLALGLTLCSAAAFAGSPYTIAFSLKTVTPGTRRASPSR